MRFNLIIKYCAIPLILLMAKSSSANEVLTKQEVTLMIKPLACIVKNAGEKCQMTINAHWLSNAPISSCLFQGEQSLSCWEKTTEVNQRFDVTLLQDMQFSLRSAEGETFAQQKIQVNSSTPKQYRRRLRSQWSLF